MMQRKNTFNTAFKPQYNAKQENKIYIYNY